MPEAREVLLALRVPPGRVEVEACDGRPEPRVMKKGADVGMGEHVRILQVAGSRQ